MVFSLNPSRVVSLFDHDQALLEIRVLQQMFAFDCRNAPL